MHRIPRSIYQPARDVARAVAQTRAFERSCRDRKRVETLFAQGAPSSSSRGLLLRRTSGGSLSWWCDRRGFLFSQSDLFNIIPNLRLVLFGGLIVLFLVVEPEGP